MTIAVESNYHEIWVSAWHPNPPSHYFHSIMLHCPVPQFVKSENISQIIVSEDVACDKEGTRLAVKDTTRSVVVNHLEDFCVCVKPLDFPNEPLLADRLIEWIEANLELGAGKIVFYVYSGTSLCYFETQTRYSIDDGRRNSTLDYFEVQAILFYEASTEIYEFSSTAKGSQSC